MPETGSRSPLTDRPETLVIPLPLNDPDWALLRRCASSRRWPGGNDLDGCSDVWRYVVDHEVVVEHHVIGRIEWWLFVIA